MELLTRSVPVRVALLAVVLLGSVPVLADTASKEYQVKAVFLFNFANFVDWPATSFPAAATPFVIGILGDNPFGTYLDDVVRGEKIGNHPVELRRYDREDEIGTCQVLFINRSEIDRLEAIRATLKARHVLTVGETDEFARNGGIIAFVVRSGKLRLKINLEAARASNLTISSKLLRSAEIVNAGRQ